MLKTAAFIAAASLCLAAVAARAGEDLRLPMGPRIKAGIYVDFMHSFKFGKISILQDPDKALGPEKINVAAAWSLGDGYIIVGHTKGTGKEKNVVCFQNGPGWDIAVHEPPRDNKIGSVEVFVADDNVLTTSSKWFSLGFHYTSDPAVHDNYLLFSMEDAIDSDGRPKKTEKGFWVKIQNYEPERNEDGSLYLSPFHAGFDVSAVKLHYPCERLVSLLGVEKIHE